jgi:hypothetical protein
MQNPGMIVVSLFEVQVGYNIVRWPVRLVNQKGLSDSTITVGWVEEVILNSDHEYR